MTPKHEAILNELDRKAELHRCTFQGKNIIDRIRISIDEYSLLVTVSKSREGGYIAAVTVGGNVESSWGRKASDAVIELGKKLRAKKDGPSDIVPYRSAA